VAKTKKVLNPEGCPAQVAANLTLTEKCLLQAFTGVIMIELPGKKILACQFDKFWRNR
jgi:hypothetical protein